MKSTLSLIIIFLFFTGSAPGQAVCSVPDTLFAADTIVICTGTSGPVDAVQVPGAAYNWSTGETSMPSIVANTQGKYWVQVSDGVCTKTDTTTVLFNSFLLAPQVSDVLLCKGTNAPRLTAPGRNLLWYDTPLGGTGSSQAPLPSTADTARWEEWVSQTINGCESPRSLIRVRVIDKPQFELGPAFIIPCDATGIVLQIVPDEFSNYRWSDGGTGVSMLAEKRGFYSLYAQNMCGNHRDTVQAVECKDVCVQFPTAFTPNEDGLNDRFRAAVFCPVQQYRLVVYNRNGEMVFQSQDPKAGWDGYVKGKRQPDGVFVYYCEYYDFVLKQNRFTKGTVALLK